MNERTIVDEATELGVSNEADEASGERAPRTGDAPGVGPLSTYELIRTLQLAGFRLRGTMRGHAVIEDHQSICFVPVADELCAEQVLGLLETAGVSREAFLSLREHVATREYGDSSLEGAAPDSFREAEATTGVRDRVRSEG
jgi:hypothetical protein